MQLVDDRLLLCDGLADYLGMRVPGAARSAGDPGEVGLRSQLTRPRFLWFTLPPCAASPCNDSRHAALTRRSCRGEGAVPVARLSGPVPRDPLRGSRPDAYPRVRSPVLDGSSSRPRALIAARCKSRRQTARFDASHGAAGESPETSPETRIATSQYAPTTESAGASDRRSGPAGDGRHSRNV